MSKCGSNSPAHDDVRRVGGKYSSGAETAVVHVSGGAETAVVPASGGVETAVVPASGGAETRRPSLRRIRTYTIHILSRRFWKPINRERRDDDDAATDRAPANTKIKNTISPPSRA